MKETVAIIAHDSGGAEILSSWVLRSNYNYIFVIQGPAKNIFFRKIPNIKIHDLYDAINKCDWVLTETGGSTNLNYKAILTAKKKEKRVVSFLDHWSGYIGRFTRNGISIFPDEIWAGDIDSYNLARLNFPPKIVKLKDNPYWKDILENHDKEKPDIGSDDFLYVSSNFDNAHREQDIKVSDVAILGKVIKQITRYAHSTKNIVITIRAHPSEDIDKYCDFTSPYMNVLCDSESDLAKSVLRHKYIVGTNSMALVVGKILGKTTINALFEDRLSTLPDKYIDHAFKVNV
jgi:hypothetical protein